jgi:type IV secretion system protein VirB2
MFGTKFEIRSKRSVYDMKMKMGNLRKWGSVVCLAFVLVMLAGSMACATGTGTGLPWEDKIKMVADSLSGPVAFSVMVLGVFACGIALAFGADLQGWVRTVVQITLIACLIGMSVPFLEKIGLSSTVVL